MPLLHSIFQKKNSGKFWESFRHNIHDSLQIFSGTMIKFSKKNSCFISKTFELQGNIFSYVNGKGIKKQRNIQFDIFNVEKQSGKYEFSFSLRYGSLNKIFFCSNSQEFNSWCKEIKKKCLNISFSEDFDVIDQLGKGSTAKVYAVKSVNADFVYACKIFDKKLALKDPKIIEAIQFETIVMRYLNHPLIVQLNYLYEDEDRIYLIFELINGQMLLDYLLTHERFNEDDAKIILTKMLSILDYLSSRKIIHRDIKLENVMIVKGKDGQIDIKLIDFGFATGSDIINTAYIYGTPGYIAPEMLEGDLFDFKADIFSLGVMLYILLSGIKPFRSISRERVIELNQRAELSFDNLIWKYISQDAQNLIKAMTAKNPRQRISCKEALNNSWLDDKAIFYSLPTETDADYDDDNEEDDGQFTLEQKIKAKYFTIKTKRLN